MTNVLFGGGWSRGRGAGPAAPILGHLQAVYGQGIFNHHGRPTLNIRFPFVIATNTCPLGSLRPLGYSTQLLYGWYEEPLPHHGMQGPAEKIGCVFHD